MERETREAHCQIQHEKAYTKMVKIELIQLDMDVRVSIEFSEEYDQMTG